MLLSYCKYPTEGYFNHLFSSQLYIKGHPEGCLFDCMEKNKKIVNLVKIKRAPMSALNCIKNIKIVLLQKLRRKIRSLYFRRRFPRLNYLFHLYPLQWLRI